MMVPAVAAFMGGIRSGSLRKRQNDALKRFLSRFDAARARNPLIRDGSSFVGRVFSHKLFEPGCILLVVANALWIGVETDLPPQAGVNPMEHVFAASFSLEIVIRILAYKQPSGFFVDPANKLSNVFDLVLVLLLIFESYVLLIIWGDSRPDLPAFGILRLFRLARLGKMFRLVPEIAIMVKSLFAAIRSSGTAFVLAILSMFVVSVLITQWAKGHDQKNSCDGILCMEAAFGNIPRSLLTLMQVLCFDNAFALVHAILDESWPYGCLVMLFMAASAFTLLNILIGVICKVISETKVEEQKKMLKEQVDRVISVLDADGDGRLDRGELDTPVARKVFLKIGVDEGALEHTFALVENDVKGAIDLDEFKHTMMKLMQMPDAMDVQIIKRKLMNLEEAFAEFANDGRLGAEEEMAKSRFDVIDEKLRELECAWGHAEQAVPEPELVACETPRTQFDIMLLNLDEAMRDLQTRLQGCVDLGSHPRDGVREGGLGDSQAIEPSELRAMKRRCRDVIQHLSAASSIISQATAPT